MRRSPTERQQIYFSTGRTSRTICVLGLVTCWIVCIVCLILGIVVYRRGRVLVPILGITREVVPLFINILVTVFNEVLGYIHGISLRWGLQKEGRLIFNTNLRLMTSTKTSTSISNSWYINVLMLLAMIISYSSTPLIILGAFPPSSQDSHDNSTKYSHVSGVAIIACSSALLFQALFATCSLFSSFAIPTWSSDPLDTAAACIMLTPGLRRVPCRCMLSVHDAVQPPSPTLPRRRQGSAYRAHIQIKKVLRWLWFVVLEALLFGTVVLVVTKGGTGTFGTNWSIFPAGDAPSANIGWQADLRTGMITDGTLLRGLAILSGFQALLTFGIHCAELQVNCSRDESIWRTAGKPSGLQRDTNILSRALTSWQTLVMLVVKPTMHWMYSLAVSAWYSVGVHIEPVQLFYLAIMTIALAIFATCIANHKPEGPQPATYGHLQTIVNLVDRWPPEGKRLYWGHSGRENGMAHAGTSGEKLGPIHMGEYYMD